MKENTKKHVPYVSQMQQTECGLCCCAMLLRYYNSNESLSELRNFLDVGRDGLTIKQLELLLNNKGFNTKIYKGTIDGLKNLKLPVIVFWENDHFIVVEKINKSLVYIVDPATGRKKISEEEFINNFSNYILYAQPTERFIPKKEKTKNVWSHILLSVFERKVLFTGVLIFSFVSYMLTLGIPILVQKLIDHIIVTNNINSISTFIIGTTIISVLYGLFILFRGIKVVSLNLFLSKKLVTDTFSHLLKLPYKFFDLRSSGDLLYRLSSINGVRELLSTQLVGGIIELGVLIFITGYMTYKSIILTLIAIIIFTINTIFMFMLRPAMSQSIDNEIIEQSKAQSIQIEALFSIMSIKLSGMEEEVYNSWNNSYMEVLNCFKRRGILQNISNTVNSLIQTVSPVIILIIGMFLYLKNQLTLGEVIAYQSLSMNFFGLSTSLFGAYTQYLLATSYLERVSDITDTEIESNPKNPVKHEITGDITLNNVSFSYTKHSPEVLKNISLHIKKGEKVAIVGSSGSGKSTLSKILVSLYTPTSGQVLYDSIDIQNLNKKEIFKQMGIVPQDITLLNKSIMKNIEMSKENVDIEKIKKAAKVSQIADEIESMPMGYYTVISEMGMNLSGGQRQRIALARALLNDPKIIILDEATSSLDVINEAKISEYLSELGCTRIIIAHRLSTIIDSDVIYVMDQGQIVEKGTHAELINIHGLYHKLYSSQANK